MNTAGPTSFCGVFLHHGRLYVCRELDNAGRGRVMVLPPTEIPMDVDAASLGSRILEALDAFGATDHLIRGPEMDGLQRELLATVGESSVAAFEKRKKEVTIRRDASREITLFRGANGTEMTLEAPGPAQLGGAVGDLLGLKRLAARQRADRGEQER